ncbi:hypothetical protein BJX63DRAFT_180941 [Aspergillus granulosus]|uniref:Uncharacterized protein n=1 Tax=Aspergillus granulosus TaxID=176169 RepID=A0ABR4I5C2_9EURO
MPYPLPCWICTCITQDHRINSQDNNYQSVLLLRVLFTSFPRISVALFHLKLSSRNCRLFEIPWLRENTRPPACMISTRETPPTLLKHEAQPDGSHSGAFDLPSAEIKIEHLNALTGPRDLAPSCPGELDAPQLPHARNLPDLVRILRDFISLLTVASLIRCGRTLWGPILPIEGASPFGWIHSSPCSPKITGPRVVEMEMTALGGHGRRPRS